MFRTAELGRKIPKAEYKEIEPVLRQELLELQQTLRLEDGFPVIIVFAGVDGGGKNATVNRLNAWMDPRWLITRAYGEPSDEERERPEYWRYWRDLPPKGRIGLFLRSWYSRPVIDRAYGSIDEADFDERLDRVINFENALADDGALIIKFWMHLSREAQKKRLKALEKDPLTRWQVTETDWHHWRLYDQFLEAGERVIMRTSTGKAPWSIVEGVDPYYRSVTVGRTIRDAVRRRLEEVAARRRLQAEMQAGKEEAKPARRRRPGTAGTEPEPPAPVTVLDSLEMKRLDKRGYRKAYKQLQGRLNELQRRAQERKISTILVFEGPDAAGKGGAIRRVTESLDARNYQVLPFAAPTDEEKAQHYLWRFWRHLSRAGRVTLFDRSWYGRVLVERVEGFAGETEWRRAYSEINDFEAQLIEHGIVLMKYWVHISKEEQLRRFQDREQTPHKRWKLTADDWRNREKWNDYLLAVNDMVEHTSTRLAPWNLVEGDDKPYARIKVMSTLCDKLEQVLGEE
ncbi:polyphosphate:AMP phosphotransferase [Thioalbus denitrificans]|uniref:Polyphosphate:AMP phosphotransferase n=1 Tax=Thioalbus denitrificans TaxID=547122 RepID=A0A369C9B8_9GAMM|nr:polyphosphate:AMP phosphotransferase [Thioalbus denitrificans]RCX28384.1 polyphosphate:AMP phosphotransferase [Thioalbus denitrificans]